MTSALFDDAADDTPEHEAGETPEEELREEAQSWLEKIQKREDVFRSGWWKDAEASQKVYCMEKPASGDTQTESVYNILYSNTSVLLPSLYSATPKPDTRSRFPSVDVGPVAEACNRFLTVFADTANPAIESFDEAIAATVLGGLTTAMGYARLRHYPERSMPLALESGDHKSLIWGKARKWAKVPWIAFRHELTKAELFSLFKIEKDKESLYTPPEADNGKEQIFGTVVYELWIKAEKRILFICEHWQPLLIQEAPDTMQLEGFFPLPGFISFTPMPERLEPQTLFNFYRNQATELDRVSVRLNRVLSAIRVRGVYHNLLGEELKSLLSSTDTENALVPASDAGFLAQMGSLEKGIWLLPIEKLIVVAQELYKAREAIKQVIYELTGISDILRGSSVASETATAQGLKNKWGTVRLRQMQVQIANYVRDFFRLAIDAATNVVTPKAWKEVTQMTLLMQGEKMQLQQQLAMMQHGASQMPPDMPGQPPNPQTAQLQQQMQGLQQKLGPPSVEEALAKIKNDASRLFVINVQTSSTLDLDTSSDKAEIAEFMNSLGQLLAGLQPLGSFGPSGVEVIKETLIAVCQRYKFGLQILDAIENLQAPPPPNPDAPDPVKLAQADALKQKTAMEAQAQQAEFARKTAETQHQAQLQALELQTAQKTAMMQQQLLASELQDKIEKMKIDSEILQIKVAEARLRLANRSTTMTPASPQ